MLEVIVEFIVQFFSQTLFDKILKPLFRRTGTYYLRFLNLFLKEKIDLSLSPNKGAIGLIIWFMILVLIVGIIVN